MLVTREPALKNYWYPVMPLAHLNSGPMPFTLLNEKIVLWLDEQGKPAAAVDKCCHRSAVLSKGWVEKGSVVCPYHAWAFGPNGQCTSLPQQADKAIPKSICIKAFHCEAKYGYAWVCLGTPLRPIPEFKEAKDPAYRTFPCFYEVWNTTSLRVVENELDMAHFAVVHRGTFGDPATANPLEEKINDIDPFTVHVDATLSVRPPDQQKKNTGEEKSISTRKMDVVWHFPFLIQLGLTYPSGLHHLIINHPTPIDDNHIQVVQFCFRNDSENETSVDEILAFERLILNEDKAVLESTDPDVPLDTSEVMHLVTDKPGILVRRKIAKQLEANRKAPSIARGAPVAKRLSV